MDEMNKEGMPAEETTPEVNPEQAPAPEPSPVQPPPVAVYITNPTPAEEKKPAGLGIASLILGILSILLVCVPVVPIITALIGIILGGIGLKKAAEGTAGGKGMSIAGLVMSIICMLLGLVLTIFLGGSILVPSMLGYTKKSNQAAINSDAKAIYDAAATALVEMDSAGYELPSNAIVCSDSSKNYGTSYFDTYEFQSKMETYYSELDEHEYYVVISYGSVQEVACYEDRKENTVGRYPMTISVDSDVTFDELYSDALWYMP